MSSLLPFRAGLVSVTFRKLPAETVAHLAVEAGLSVIEWGGDLHVPHGDVGRAKAIGALSRNLGLATGYGSYYRAGVSETAGLSFESVLDSALALGAGLIRVWAGDRGSAAADDAHWARVVQDTRRIATLSAHAGIRVAFERHGGTLTDTDETHRRLLAACAEPHLLTYWQPDPVQSAEDNRLSLTSLLDRLANVHVFYWTAPPIRRWPLADGHKDWRLYLDLLRGSPQPHDLLLEFVENDDPAALRRDAALLHGWVDALNRNSPGIQAEAIKRP